MKKYLLTGFITLLPIVITLVVIIYLFDLFTAPFSGIIEKIILAYEKKNNIDLLHHETIVTVLSRMIAFVLLFFLILFLGFLGRKFFFSPLIRLGNRLLMRIPIVKTIYRLSREITSAVFSGDEKTFKESVLIPFPTPATHALGLVTGGIPPSIQQKILNDHLCVFVPTSPHPISGFLLLAPKEVIIPVDVSVEDTFKFLISCGVIHPGTPKKETHE